MEWPRHSGIGGVWWEGLCVNYTYRPSCSPALSVVTLHTESRGEPRCTGGRRKVQIGGKAQVRCPLAYFWKPRSHRRSIDLILGSPDMDSALFIRLFRFSHPIPPLPPPPSTTTTTMDIDTDWCLTCERRLVRLLASTQVLVLIICLSGVFRPALLFTRMPTREKEGIIRG